MMIDTRIYGYVGDGFICCTECAQRIQDNEDVGPDELRPLHSSDDTEPCGETCECGAIIFAESDDHGLDEACRSCGYEVPATWAVVTDDSRRIVLARFQSENLAEDHAWELVYGDGDEDGDKYLDAPLKVIETDYEEPGVGGRLPIPGEQVLPGLATV